MRFVVVFAILACLGASVSAASNRTYVASYPSWRQCDSRWKGDQLGTCSETICKAGCAITSVAMFIAGRGYGGDPGKFNQWLKSNGGYVSGCDIVWGKVDNLGYSSFQGREKPAYSVVCDGVNNGHGIIANVNKGHHYVLVTGCTGSSSYTVNDPAGRQSTFTHDSVLHFEVYH